MESAGAAPREIAVPVSVFAVLRSELEKEAGELPTIRALHHAGYRAGAEAAAWFGASGEDGVGVMAQSAFWSSLCDGFARRGWGSLSHDLERAGVGLLASPDWAEASGEGPDPDASCSFSTGFLSGLLSELASGPVAVLEVECRTRGDDQCRFAFGSESTIHDLYGRLLDGAGLDGALEAL